MSNVSPIKKIIHYLTDRHRYTINELGKSFKTVVLGMIKTGNARRYLIRIGVLCYNLTWFVIYDCKLLEKFAFCRCMT